MKQKPTISTVDQLMEIVPYTPMIAWLADSGITDLADAWDRCHRADWMLWICDALSLLDDRKLRLIACGCVRETPLDDGRKVWDLLTDERSRQAVIVAERYAAGEATDEKLATAYVSASYAAGAAASYAARAHVAAAAAAARAAAWAVAEAASEYAADATYAARADATATATTSAAADAARAAAMAAEAAAYEAAAEATWAAEAATAASLAARVDAAATSRVDAEAAARAAQADIIRAIAGNPFRDS